MKILFSAESFGYGPIITGLNIVKELKKYNDINIDFIGSGVALEQAKMTDYFENFIECDTFDLEELEKNKKLILSYNSLISSENMNGAIFAIRNRMNKIYYIDNLMWMWDKLPKELNKVNKYFISEIIPSKYNFSRIGKEIENPVFVGALRNLNNYSTFDSKEKKQLIINIGGAESFLFDSKLIIKFYNILLKLILNLNEIEQFEKIIVCGGYNIISNLKLDITNKNIILKSLSNDEYLKEMALSSHCIMASGLGNFIETIGMKKNIMYLPAINYSQLLQLQYYVNQNFGFHTMNWEKFPFYKQVGSYLDEELGVNLVINNVENFINGNYEDIVLDNVRKFLAEPQDKYFENRKLYIDKMSKNSNEVVARIIIEDLKEGV